MSSRADDTLSLDELIAAVGTRGCRVTCAQIKRLRTGGLLRCLGQEHRQGLHGTRSRYAPSEVDQLELVMRLGQIERRFDHRRVLVAWHGGWVEPQALRNSLATILAKTSVQIRKQTAGMKDPEDAADRLVRSEHHKGRLSKQRRLIRQRLGGSARAEHSAIYALATLAFGGSPALSEHDPNSTEEPLGHIIERAVGIDKARTDRLGSRGPLVPSDVSVEEVLSSLQRAGMLDMRELEQAVLTASDEQIQQAFEDAQTIADLGPFGEAAEASYGEDVAGLGSLTAGRPDAHDAATISFLVRYMLLMRRIVPDGAIETAANQRARLVSTALIELRKQFPEHADVLTFEIDAKLAELPDGEADALRCKFRDFLRSRADLRSLLDGDKTAH